jgi:hypothetical protein
MSASWASHLYTREICGCVEKGGGLVGTARKAISPVRSYWESTATFPITDAVRIKKFSESVTRSKVSDQCSSRRPTAPARNSGR